MKTAEKWYDENPSLRRIDLGGVIGLIERIQNDALDSAAEIAERLKHPVTVKKIRDLKGIR